MTTFSHISTRSLTSPYGTFWQYHDFIWLIYPVSLLSTNYKPLELDFQSSFLTFPKYVHTRKPINKNAKLSISAKIWYLQRLKRTMGSKVSRAIYWTIRDHTGPYGANQDQTGPYGTTQDHRRPYGTIQNYMAPCRIKWDHMWPYGNICDHTGP